MGSGFKTFTAGSVLTASDVNNYLMEQSVMVFSSSAARSSAISSPEVGMTTYLTDTGAFEVYYGSTTGWKPPWASAWGLVPVTSGANPDSVTANQSGITTTTDITGLTATFTAVANRNYRLEIVTNVLSSGIGDICQVFITDSSNNVHFQGAVNSQNGSFGVSLIVSGVKTFSAGSTTVKGRIAKQSGSGSVLLVAGSVYPTLLTIEDIGPAGNPPAS